MDRETALENALLVMVMSPEIRSFLEKHDPKALEQANAALDWPKQYIGIQLIVPSQYGF